MRSARLLTIILAVVLAAGMVAPVMAQSGPVSTDISTSYDGVADGRQAIDVEATFSASSDVTGLEIQFRETENSFIDYQDSFNITTSSNVESERTNRRTFLIEELPAGETVTISFTAYPRTLDQEELRAAVIGMTAENPRTFEDSAVVTADTSSSPLLAYQSAQDQLDQFELLRTVGIGGVVGAALIGLLGLVTAGYTWRMRLPSEIDEKEEEIASDLDNLLDDVQDPILADEIERIKNKYESEGILASDDDLDDL
ncbi:hypothetical protein [Halobellus limi]|uniref:Uncharacterized protein n=2 Tax=Halobellus limi TaxID=699433 RepID=A0A1H6CS12_9EURY|nr:hypothetical protein [Halobellus limi]SEG75567.1 hypothetical protein SAMN04488133_3680 [Halobellus limi]